MLIHAQPLSTIGTQGANAPTIAPQSEVYHGIQIYHDKRGYWFVTPRGAVERSKNIERIRRSIDIVQMVLSTHNNKP